MGASISPGWLINQLETHFTGEELKQIQGYIQEESWVTPSTRRKWSNSRDTIPLRFELNIDMKV